MGLPLFSSVNAVDGSTLTGTAIADTLPVANLADEIIGKPWRSANSNSFTSVFAAASDVGILGLAGCSASSGDDVRHKLYDSSNVLLYDSGDITFDIVSGLGKHFHIPTDGVIAGVKKWVCTFDASASLGSDPLDMGRAWAGPIWQPSIGMSYGWNRGYASNKTPVVGKRSGIKFPSDGVQWLVLNFTLDWLSDTDADTADEFMRSVDPSTQCLVIPDTELAINKLGLIGRRTSLSPVAQNVAVFPAAYTQAFTFEEDK